MSDLYENKAIRERAERLVREEVLCCVSRMVTLVTPAIYAGAVEDYTEDDLYPLLSRPDWDEPADIYAHDDLDLHDAIEVLDDDDVDRAEWMFPEGLGQAREFVLKVFSEGEVTTRGPLGIDFEAFCDRFNLLVVPENPENPGPTSFEGMAREFVKGKMDIDQIVEWVVDNGIDSLDYELRFRARGEVIRRLETSLNAEEFCRRFNLDPDEIEVYEHWAVTGWFKDKLSQYGQAVGELLGLDIWGRTTTGQSICMDGVILRIAKDLMDPSEYEEKPKVTDAVVSE